jgi:hypothetical protein
LVRRRSIYEGGARKRPQDSAIEFPDRVVFDNWRKAAAIKGQIFEPSGCLGLLGFQFVETFAGVRLQVTRVFDGCFVIARYAGRDHAHKPYDDVQEIGVVSASAATLVRGKGERAIQWAGFSSFGCEDEESVHFDDVVSERKIGLQDLSGLRPEGATRQ